MQPRHPLAAKSTNVQRSRSTSPLKRVESPTKKSVLSSSPSKKARFSPIKKELPMTTSLNRPSAKPFNIFQDSSYARTEHTSSSSSSSPRHLIPIFRDANLSDKENEGSSVLDTQSENKENLHLPASCIPPHRQIRPSRTRKPLTDLNINSFPGYVHQGPLKPLVQIHQLKEPWSTNSFSNISKPMKRLMVPSYITPPKRNRVHLYKFVSDSNSNTQVKNLLPKLECHDDTYLNDVSVPPTFYVYNDKLDSREDDPTV